MTGARGASISVMFCRSEIITPLPLLAGAGSGAAGGGAAAGALVEGMIVFSGSLIFGPTNRSGAGCLGAFLLL